MNPHAQVVSVPGEKDRRLRTDLEHHVLEKLIDRVAGAASDDDCILKIASLLCEIRKQDAAAEKNLVTLLVAENKESARNATGSRPQRHPAANANPDSAPDEAALRPLARDHLARAVREIYGITINVGDDPDEDPPGSCPDCRPAAPTAPDPDVAADVVARRAAPSRIDCHAPIPSRPTAFARRRTPAGAPRLCPLNERSERSAPSPRRSVFHSPRPFPALPRPPP